MTCHVSSMVDRPVSSIFPVTSKSSTFRILCPVCHFPRDPRRNSGKQRSFNSQRCIFLQYCTFSFNGNSYFQHLTTGLHKFSKTSRRQKGDMTQVPYWGLTDIRRPRTKYSGPGDLTAGICAPLPYVSPKWPQFPSLFASHWLKTLTHNVPWNIQSKWFCETLE